MNKNDRNRGRKDKDLVSTDADISAELAFETLLDLAEVELVKPVKKEKKKVEKIKSYVGLSENEKVGKKDLQQIIFQARQKTETLESVMWRDPEEIPEQEIIKNAQKKGKSEYDSDVLRELILKRQRERRKTENIFGSLLASVKKNRDDYDK
ncbi:hypothetical protein SHELI_v1c03910 [Spiroplasma helicoides]|uniref:Uncharacterized protein n=2 Tax=Spiroplasma helicoides TaxID=216938 RepID=A0A1B3SK86_9MOLU|nr:hypothetical protein SHELI_v1c03910 [Spiroplasma helicoides]